ncbi:hypothetical protein [Methylobacterium sp. ID0610]|uniref:hypothetical protein n=1 Tax=Methylobacterium carpenticola TaxID=3344827 RepID=UPI0036ABF2BE
MLGSCRNLPAHRGAPFPTPQRSAGWQPGHAADPGDGGQTVVLIGLCLLVGGAIVLVLLQTLLILRAF